MVKTVNEMYNTTHHTLIQTLYFALLIDPVGLNLKKLVPYGTNVRLLLSAIQALVMTSILDRVIRHTVVHQ